MKHDAVDDTRRHEGDKGIRLDACVMTSVNGCNHANVMEEKKLRTPPKSFWMFTRTLLTYDSVEQISFAAPSTSGGRRSRAVVVLRSTVDPGRSGRRSQRLPHPNQGQYCWPGTDRQRPWSLLYSSQSAAPMRRSLSVLPRRRVPFRAGGRSLSPSTLFYRTDLEQDDNKHCLIVFER